MCAKSKVRCRVGEKRENNHGGRNELARFLPWGTPCMSIGGFVLTKWYWLARCCPPTIASSSGQSRLFRKGVVGWDVSVILRPGSNSWAIAFHLGSDG